jgi:hypothetical protein
VYNTVHHSFGTEVPILFTLAAEIFELMLYLHNIMKSLYGVTIRAGLH